MHPEADNDPCALAVEVAERAAKIREGWKPSVRYLRYKGIAGRDRESVMLARQLKKQERYTVPCVHVFPIDYYRFGIGYWRPDAWHI